MCWHKWDKWADPVAYVLAGAVEKDGMVSCGFKQQRECQKCGKVEVRRL